MMKLWIFFSLSLVLHKEIALIVDVITTRQECLLNSTYVGNLVQNSVAFCVGWNQPIRNSEIETSHQRNRILFFFSLRRLDWIDNQYYSNV